MLSLIALTATVLAPSASAFERPQRPSARTPRSSLPTTPTSWSGGYKRRSEARCDVTVSAKTRSNAVSSFGSVMAKLTGRFCGLADEAVPGDGSWKSNPWRLKSDSTTEEIKAIAKFVLESKIKCTTSGRYALACGDTFAEATSFAGASLEAFASAWATIQSDVGKCDCGVDVLAKADAVTSSWAKIWAKIYASIDEEACASTDEFDAFPNEIDLETRVKCVGRVILSSFLQASAKIYKDGGCKADEPVRCKACCENPETGEPYVPGCKNEDCELECTESVHAAAIAVADAKITNTVDVKTARCKETIDRGLFRIEADFTDYVFKGEVSGPSTSSASCEAASYAGVEASAVSDSAYAAVGVLGEFCQVPPVSVPIEYKVDAFIEAYVNVLNGAYASCTAEGGDEDFDGGCALATSFTRGYAEACATAIAEADVTRIIGETSCDCDVSVVALANATAREVEVLFVSIAQEVEAYACNPDQSGGSSVASIVSLCQTKIYATAFAKAVAKVFIEGSCVPGTKQDYCKDRCQTITDPKKPEWSTCLANCEKKSGLEARAVVDAIAEIDVKLSGECIDDSTPNQPGVSEAYKTAFEASSSVDQ